jgi:hypothetical protein
LSTFWAVPACPSLKNFEPYWIALQILSLASALFRYRTTRASSALVASSVLIFYPDQTCKVKYWTIVRTQEIIEFNSIEHGQSTF